MKVKNYRPPIRLAGAALATLAIALSAQADYQSTVVSQGPVGYWRLNEAIQPQPTSPAVNLGSLGAAANGTYNNFVTRGLTGPFAGSVAIGLDGTSQSVSTPFTPGLNNTSFSLEMWVKTAVVPKFAYVAASAVMASPRSGWYLAQDDGSTFGVGDAFVVRLFNQNGTTPTVQLAVPINQPAGTWYHLVLTYDGTTAAMYSNGSLVTNRAAAYVPNVSAAFSVGMRSDNAFWWPGQAAEVAMYGAALPATRVAAHYTAATTAPATYASAVQADAPLLYHRYTEAIDPPAVNLGTLGAAANGMYMYNAVAGVPAAANPPYVGFEANNKAVSFDGGGGVVRIPALNLKTNTVTMSAWVKANGAQSAGAALISSHAGGTIAGLTIDQVYGGLGLGYIWDNNNYGWSPTADSLLPQLPDNSWAFVAMVIEPTQAALFVCDQNNYLNFTGVTNSFNVSHANQAFDGLTLIGAEAGVATHNFNGAIDEVAVFNRALGAGELYTQYATAVGSVPPKIFADLQGPTDQVLAGDPLVLTVDAGGTPPLTFTWKKGATTVATTTSGVYTIANSALSDSGTYSVTIANASGTAPSQSVNVVVTSPSAPSITRLEGFNNRSIYTNGTLRLAVTAVGGGLKYQWKKGTTDIAGATGTSYSIASLVPGDAGSYSVLVTNTLGQATGGPVTITVPTLTAGSYEALVVAARPAAWWRLNEPAGSTTLFDSMGRYDGIYTNAAGGANSGVTLGVPGALSNNPDTAASFNPTSQGIGLIPWSPGLNSGQLTIEAWVKTSNTGGTLVPVSSFDGVNGNWVQTINGWWYGDCSGGYYGNNNNVNTAAQIVPGEWAHVVLLYDQTRQISGTYYPNVLYVNGETDGYVWGGPTTPNGSAPFLIGARNGASPAIADRFFQGEVDEVAVYNRTLSATEIQSHFTGRFGVTTKPYFIGAFAPQTVTTGKSVSFSTVVQGSSPITLQWYKDSTPLAGETTTRLSIANTATTDTGTYTLWATNVAGTASQSVSLTVLSPVAYANVTNDLVLHMRFDGDTTDTSGRGNNGTPVGAPAFGAGLIGTQALTFTTLTNDGGAVASADYVDLGLPVDLRFGSASSFTMGLWVKLPATSMPGDLPFIGNATNSMNNPGWALGPTYRSGGWQWCLNDGVNNIDIGGPDNSINDGNWHHFMLSVDRTTKLARTYLDGVCVAQTDVTSLGSIDNNNYWPITIGQDPTGLYPEWGTATIDDLGIWKRALTAEQVAQIESAGRTGNRSFDTVNPNPDVKITVTRSGSSVTLSWSQGTLEQSDTLGATASWSNVTGAAAPSYTFTPAATGSKFYRVKVQ